MKNRLMALVEEAAAKKEVESFDIGDQVEVHVRILEGQKERIQVFQGSQDDGVFLHRVASQSAPEGLDIIIDDASHLGALTKQTFWHLFDQHLKPGGHYIIEDWGTGYWEDWPDGRAQQQPGWWSRLLQKLKGSTLKDAWPTHSHGMVGFVKELVDEMGVTELTRGRREGVSLRESRFERLALTSGQVVVSKKQI